MTHGNGRKTHDVRRGIGARITRRRGDPRAAAPGLGCLYWRLWGATGASSLGDGMIFVGFPLLASTLTRDPRLVAGLTVAAQLPWLLFGLHAGVMADRIDRRRLALTVQVVRAVILVGFGATLLAGVRSLVIVYVVAFALGALDTIFTAVAHAVLPAMVNESDLERANGYLFSAQTAGEQFAGPALGGLAFATAPALPFVADGISFAASGALLSRAIPPSPAGAASRSWSGIAADARQGLRFFLGHPVLRLVALVISTFAFCQAMVLSVVVLYALEDLGLDSRAYGMFVALAAVGNIGGGVLAGRFGGRVAAAPAIATAGIAASASYLVLAGTTSVTLAAASLVVEALAVAAGNVVTLSLRQRLIPSELLGRVGNAFRTVLFGVVPIGALLAGAVAKAASPQTAFAVAGCIQAVVVVLVSPRLVRRLRTGAALTTAPAHAEGP